MPGLEELYREIILDHYRSPRNRGELDSPPATKVDGQNPLYLQLEGSGDNAFVADVKIAGQGCSISQSSASMMTGVIMGKKVGEIRAVSRRFKSMMGLEDIETEAGDGEVDLGDLEALQGVMKFPVRIKCAVLGWNTLTSALDEALNPPE